MTTESFVYQADVLKRMLKVIAGVVNTKYQKYSNTLAFADAVVKNVIDRKFPDHFLAKLLIEKIKEREEAENRKLMRSSLSRGKSETIIDGFNKGQVDLLGKYNSKTPVFHHHSVEIIHYRLLLSFGLEVTNTERPLLSKDDLDKGDIEVLFSAIYQSIMATLEKLPASDQIIPKISETVSASDLVVKLLVQIPDSLLVRMNLSLTFGEADSSNYLSHLSAALSSLIKKMIETDEFKTSIVCENLNVIFEQPQLVAKSAATKPTVTKALRFFDFLSSSQQEKRDTESTLKEKLRVLDPIGKQLILMNILMDAYGQITALANIRNLILKSTTQCMPTLSVSSAPLRITAAQAAASGTFYAESPRLSDFQDGDTNAADRFIQLTKDFSHPSLVTVIHGVTNKREITDITWEEENAEMLTTHVQFFLEHTKAVINSFAKLQWIVSSCMKEADSVDRKLLDEVLEAKMQLQLVSDQLNGLSQLALVRSTESAAMAAGSQSCPSLTTPGR